MTITFELSTKKAREIAEQVAEEYLGQVAEEVEAIQQERDLLRFTLAGLDAAALARVDREMAVWRAEKASCPPAL
jgi:uncharacterized hydantoinase/oxoprolinase family protein